MNNLLTVELTFNTAILPLLISLLIGVVIAIIFAIRNKGTSRTFLTTLCLLPAIATVMIFVTSESVGAGIAVAGTFALVRFRSAPASASQIVFTLLAVAVGVVIGAGYMVYAIIFALIILVAYFIISFFKFGDKSDMILKITVPEDLDYMSAFNEVFNKYLSFVDLKKAKLTGLGSLYELKYDVKFIDNKTQKEFIDELRLINSNLTIMLYRNLPSVEEF